MNETIRNISGTIWDKDIPAIVAGFKAEGISEFTISDDPCGMLRTLAVFEANGAKVQGLTSVKSPAGEIPAFLMQIA